MMLFYLFLAFLDLNLIDWGSNNCIAIALGPGVYILNYEDLATKCLLQIPNNDYVSSVSWVKDGNVLAMGSSNRFVQVSIVICYLISSML